MKNLKKIIKNIVFLPIASMAASCSNSNAENKVFDIRQEPIKLYCEAKTAKERLDIEALYSLSDWTQQEVPINISKYIDKTIKIAIADNENFNNAFYAKPNPGYKLGRGFCVPGKKNYFRIYEQRMTDLFDEEPVDALDGYLKVEEGDFTVEPNIVRFCNIDGMKNVRDIGGWKTSFGKHIKYQKLYRGANFQGITNAGKYEFSKTLGIKTEIDLREMGDRPDRTMLKDKSLCTLGDEFDITYVEAPIVTCSYIYPNFSQTEPEKRAYYSPTKKSLLSAFTTLSDESNYPIYFHCNAGADRTGTFAFLVEALLGVSIDDLCLDYELTCFTGVSGDQWRGPIDLETGGRVLGTARDDKQNYCAFGPLIENMLNWYGLENGAKDSSLSAAVENYLVNFIGISEEQIENIKTILLD